MTIKDDSMSLDLDLPENVSHVLRRVADKYRESTNELQGAWQDEGAGVVWSRIAVILERAAKSVDRAVEKYG